MAEKNGNGAKGGEREPEVSFARSLGFFDATMIGVGAMIGAGIFVLTGMAAGEAGPASILAFGLNGAVTLLTAMAYAELAAANVMVRISGNRDYLAILDLKRHAAVHGPAVIRARRVEYVPFGFRHRLPLAALARGTEPANSGPISLTRLARCISRWKLVVGSLKKKSLISKSPTSAAPIATDSVVKSTRRTTWNTAR